MFLRNSFTHQTRDLFFYKYDCDFCSMNGWDALHHIVGRESNSPYNASTIHNIKCHIGNSLLEQFDMKSMLLKRTKKFLDDEGYVPTPADLEFLKKHERLYNA